LRGTLGALSIKSDTDERILSRDITFF
jgi:hypothetical protein